MRFFTYETDDDGTAVAPEARPLLERRKTFLLVLSALTIILGLVQVARVVIGNSHRSDAAASDAKVAQATAGYLRQEVAFRDQATCYILVRVPQDATTRQLYKNFGCSVLLKLPQIARPTPPAGVPPLIPLVPPGSPVPTFSPSPSPRPDFGAGTPAPVVTPAPVQSTHPPPTRSPQPPSPTPTRTATPRPTPKPTPTPTHLACIEVLGHEVCTPV